MLAALLATKARACAVVPATNALAAPSWPRGDAPPLPGALAASAPSSSEPRSVCKSRMRRRAL
jgi:hypothetical protein